MIEDKTCKMCEGKATTLVFLADSHSKRRAYVCDDCSDKVECFIATGQKPSNAEIDCSMIIDAISTSSDIGDLL